MGFLKPTKRKVMVSIGLALMFGLLLLVYGITHCGCIQGFPVDGYDCGPYQYEGLAPLFFKFCYCQCPPPAWLLLITHLIIPAFVFYFLISLGSLIMKKT